MENLQHTSNNSSGDKLSFLIIPVEEENFEFGFTQIQEYSPESPADHLFLNGKLQPHDFRPVISSIDRSIDSVLSWRSNSTNSSSSTARTSCSIREACGSVSERKSSFSQRPKVAAPGRRKNNSLSRKEHSFWKQYYRQNKKPVMATDFGSSLRWQFINAGAG